MTMMPTRLGAFLLAAALSWLATAHPSAQRGNPSVQFDGQTIDEMIAGFMAERHVPGVTLAIVQAPYIPRIVGYGVSDVEKQRLASPKTLYDVGQLTRGFTAVAIMQLVEAGKLKLDDAIGKYVSDLPAAWRALSVRQLMAHASGLPDYTAQRGFDPAREYSPREIVALVRDVPVAFAPGSQAAASGTDFYLLGLAVERASGMSYEAFVTRNQIDRLGLRNTMFASSLPAVTQEGLDGAPFRHSLFLKDRRYVDPSETATGYAWTGSAFTPVRRNSDGAWGGNGAIFASAEDISLWDIALAGGLLVGAKENRDAIYRPAALAGGAAIPANAGWRFPKHPGLMDIEGNVPGFSCYLSRFTDPNELVCVTLCGNRSGIDFTDLARRIAGAFDRRLGPPAGARGMVSRESAYAAPATVERLESFLRSKGVEAAAQIDRGATVLTFGDPAVRVRIWEEGDGTVWAGYDGADGARAPLEAAIRYATAPY